MIINFKKAAEKTRIKQVLDLHASLNPWGNCLALCPDVKMTWYEQIQLDLSEKRCSLRHYKKTGKCQLQAYAIQENPPFDQQA